jgi:hypothetical protein
MMPDRAGSIARFREGVAELMAEEAACRHCAGVRAMNEGSTQPRVCKYHRRIRWILASNDQD